MGRRPGYHHSPETKRRIAASVAKAAKGAAPQEAEMVPAAPPRAVPVVAAPTIPSDPLDALAVGPVKDVIALMLWKNRHAEPELSVQITERDIAGFRACVDYLRVTPEVRIVRPQGHPGHGGIPATKTRSAIPPMPPQPARPFVVVTLVEKNTENAIKPIENNEADYALAQEAKEFQAARGRAMSIAVELQRAAATGEFSSSIIQEAAQCLVAMAR